MNLTTSNKIAAIGITTIIMITLDNIKHNQKGPHQETQFYQIKKHPTPSNTIIAIVTTILTLKRLTTSNKIRKDDVKTQK